MARAARGRRIGDGFWQYLMVVIRSRGRGMLSTAVIELICRYGRSAVKKNSLFQRHRLALWLERLE